MGSLRNILITGANGFLGSFVVNKLVNEGYRPIILLRPNSSTWRIDKIINHCIVHRLSKAKNEISDLICLHNIDCIIHLATEYGRDKALTSLLKTNVIFPISLIEADKANNLKLFINTDSFFAKKEYNQEYLKEYTSSKRILEQLLISFDKKMLRIANLRIEHVYGENDSEEKFFTSVIKRLLNNDSVIELTEGQQKRDFTYAEDVANAYLAVVKNFEKINGYQEFEVGTGKSLKLKEFIQKLANAVGSDTDLRFGALPSRKGDIEDSYARTDALINIGWCRMFTTDEAISLILKKEKQRFKQ